MILWILFQGLQILIKRYILLTLTLSQSLENVLSSFLCLKCKLTFWKLSE